MKVRATQLGYYGHKRRYEGSEFELEPIKRIRKDKDGKPREITIMPEQQFSERWMERVGPEVKTRIKPKKTMKPEHLKTDEEKKLDETSEEGEGI